METTTTKTRKPRKAPRQQKQGPAGHHIAAATMTVTVAVEEARKRGLMHRMDTRYMNQAEYNQYVDLCAREFGVTCWEESD